MKAFTDIEQSKRLAEILPLESADMLFQLGEDKYADNIRVPLTKEHWEQMMPDINPCWSLAALLEVIGIECRMEKTPLDQSGEFTYSMVDNYYNIRTYEEGNPIDACVEMIYKLKEKDLL